MTDKLKTRARIARGDGSVIVHAVSDDENKSGSKPVSSVMPVEPHDRESEVTTSITNEKLCLSPVRKTEHSCRIP